jgi:hypothetical protein
VARTEGQTRAVDRETGSIGASICAEVTVQGDVSGQLAVGSNIVQMRTGVVLPVDGGTTASVGTPRPITG